MSSPAWRTALQPRVPIGTGGDGGGGGGDGESDGGKEATRLCETADAYVGGSVASGSAVLSAPASDCMLSLSAAGSIEPSLPSECLATDGWSQPSVACS